MKCVIFGGADIEDKGFIDIPDNAYVIAADRGYIHCVSLGIVPDIAVGDFDSLDIPVSSATEIITAPCEKDETDLILAVRIAVDRGYNDFIIYGADGGRMGHMIAAVQTLSYVHTQGASAVLRGSSFDMSVCGIGDNIILNRGYRYLSLFSLSESSKIQLEDLKYSGSVTLERSFPMGVSNEFKSDKCKIRVTSGEILAVCEK